MIALFQKPEKSVPIKHSVPPAVGHSWAGSLVLAACLSLLGLESAQAGDIPGLSVMQPEIAATPSSLPAVAQEAMNDGKNAAKCQDYLPAIDHFQRALRASPNAPEVLFYLGVVESKIPGRELRAIAWLGAYLLARADAPDAGAVNSQIGNLKLAHQKTLLRVIASAETAAKVAGDNSYLEITVYDWARAGDFHSAMKLAALINYPPDRAAAYRIIAVAQAEAGHIAAAKTTSDLIQNVKEKHLAQNTIVQIQSAMNDIKGAQETWSTMSNLPEVDWVEYVRQSTASAIAEAQTKAGDRAGARKTMAAAIKNAEIVKDTKRKDNVYYDIASAQYRDGDVAGAHKTAELIKDADVRSEFRVFMVEARAEAGDISQALEIANSISDQGKLHHYQSVARSLIAKIQARRGDVAGANKTAALIQNESAKDWAQKKIAKAQEPNHPTVADWLGCLEESVLGSPCALNTQIFLDLPAHLKSLSQSDDPEKLADELHHTAGRMIETQNVIDQFLKGSKGRGDRRRNVYNPYSKNPPEAMGDSQVRQMLARYRSLDAQKAETTQEIATVKEQQKQGTGDAAVLSAQLGTLTNQITQIDTNQTKAIEAAKRQVKHLGIEWVESPEPTTRKAKSK